MRLIEYDRDAFIVWLAAEFKDVKDDEDMSRRFKSGIKCGFCTGDQGWWTALADLKIDVSTSRRWMDCIEEPLKEQVREQVDKVARIGEFLLLHDICRFPEVKKWESSYQESI